MGSISLVADEIKKYKDLLDMGVITESEFQQKKEGLLNDASLSQVVESGEDDDSNKSEKKQHVSWLLTIKRFFSSIWCIFIGLALLATIFGGSANIEGFDHSILSFDSIDVVSDSRSELTESNLIKFYDNVVSRSRADYFAIDFGDGYGLYFPNTKSGNFYYIEMNVTGFNANNMEFSWVENYTRWNSGEGNIKNKVLEYSGIDFLAWSPTNSLRDLDYVNFSYEQGSGRTNRNFWD